MPAKFSRGWLGKSGSLPVGQWLVDWGWLTPHEATRLTSLVSEARSVGKVRLEMQRYHFGQPSTGGRPFVDESRFVYVYSEELLGAEVCWRGLANLQS